MDQKSREKLARFAEDYGMSGKNIHAQLKGLETGKTEPAKPISFDYGQIEARVLGNGACADYLEARVVADTVTKGLQDEKVIGRN